MYPTFQYSLRIVGFRDLPEATRAASQVALSVFPANRGVPRPYLDHFPPRGHIDFQYSLRIVGFRDEVPCRQEEDRNSSFQYSLRIVGFRDVFR